MSALKQLISNIYLLPEAAMGKLCAALHPLFLPKGYRLFRAGKVETDIYFIEKGIARAFCHQAEQEITFWFGEENSVVLSYNSYIHQKPGYEHVELLEDSELYHLENKVLQRLYLEDIDIANWGRKLAEQELVRTEAQFIARQFKTATERYLELLRESPSLLQRVQLGHIASYLGVTQVTLSRIRSELK